MNSSYLALAFLYVLNLDYQCGVSLELFKLMTTRIVYHQQFVYISFHLFVFGICQYARVENTMHTCILSFEWTLLITATWSI